MPLDLLKSVSADLVSSLETQLSRAKDLVSLSTAYQYKGEPQDRAAIVHNLDRLCLQHDCTTDLLYAARLALEVSERRCDVT